MGEKARVIIIFVGMIKMRRVIEILNYMIINKYN